MLGLGLFYDMYKLRVWHGMDSRRGKHGHSKFSMDLSSATANKGIAALTAARLGVLGFGS